MSDWYRDGMEKIFSHVAKETGIPLDDVKKVYKSIAGLGLTDYDIEKEAIHGLDDAEGDDD